MSISVNNRISKKKKFDNTFPNEKKTDLEKATDSPHLDFKFSDLLPDFFELRSFTTGNVKVRVIDIIRIEASKSYSVFHLKLNF